MRFIIYDIEATCWEGRPPGMVQETIEIGAFEVNAYGEVGAAFSRLIKPILHPQLSHFCRQLTNIDQSDINRSRDFSRVIQAFQDWIDVDGEPYALAAWGSFDERQLRQDCDLHRMDDYWLDPHINLKAQYRDIRSLPKKRGLASAIRHEGFEWTGEQHRALDDAENTVKIFCKLLDMWRY
ncbi:3'-5' exonuclease [Neolewinella litorea]|uniref:Exonuclease domain-containing protein n=1 Tax=Neolewinella litorea TaxID=2562452 RepID=A0A4S4NNP6_9BACT|nr:3'-5' exonuclease [Neolewinella litorea]THH41629.1 exonuclease domain-containing protein [Neolewinella litorea]